jgi:hypothetical protein
MTTLKEIDMRSIVRTRSGVALPMALGALVLIGVLIAGVMFTSLQEFRIGANTQHQTRAATAAEFGLNRVLADWKPVANTTMKTGDTLKLNYTVSSGGTAQVTVTRLPGPFFFAVSEGQAGASRVDMSSRRQYGALFRLDAPQIGFLGALTGRGGITVGGSAFVSGDDYVPSGWASCPAAQDVAGVAMADTSGVKTPGCSVSKECVIGTPKYLETPAAGDTSTYFNYGNTNYTILAASANKVFPTSVTLSSPAASVTGTVCNTSVLTNWGDGNRKSPAGPCETYFPVIHAKGDMHLTGGMGQGVLLVDGDLTITGGFWFLGVVVVRGTMRSAGGAGVFGVLMAANVELDAVASTSLGSSYVQYSSCAVQSALNAAAMLTPVKERSWMEVY